LIQDCRETGWSFDNLILPLVPGSWKRLARRLVPEPLPDWIATGFASRVALHDRWQQRPTIPAFPTSAQRDLYGTLTSGWHAFQQDAVNRLQAEAGIEGRSPLHDRNLIEFALAIPESQRRRGSLTKYVLRQATGGILPESVRTRLSKAEFSHLYVQAIERECPERRLSSLCLVDDGYLSSAGVRRLHAAYRDGAADAHALWMILATESWYRALFN